MRKILLPTTLFAAGLFNPIPSMADEYHIIVVLDEADNSPVAGARFTAKHNQTYTSDDNGIIAYYEPGLMNQKVYFDVQREGYELSKPAWGGGTAPTVTQDMFSVVFLTQTGHAPEISMGTRETDHIGQGLPDSDDYFEIRFVDPETGRGIPLVTLTVDKQVYTSDNAGRIAFYEFKHMGGEVDVTLHSHGYETSVNPVSIKPVPGGELEMALTRTHAAERMYRVTGMGLYADSILLGYDTPLENPLNNGRLAGQDTVMVAPYQGELFWVWGDTLSTNNFLGNFRAAGARSDMPTSANPFQEDGIDLRYLETETGFAKQVAPDETVPGTGATWLGKLFTLQDSSGRERLYAHYGRWGAGFNMTEHGMVVFDDDKEVFKELVDWGTAHRRLMGQPNRMIVNGEDYYYFGFNTRIPANVTSIQDPTKWQAFTALNAAGTDIVRDTTGRPDYGWRTGVKPVGKTEVDRGLLSKSETLKGNFTDPLTGVPLLATPTMVVFNAHRQRWISINAQEWSPGPSFAGEHWYAEADTPMGPWVYTRKVVSHDDYTFYNPQLHPWFDQDGGRNVYFEATYTKWLTSSPATPRYDYNQIMYRLDLDHEDLGLPVPVYAVGDAKGHETLVTRAELHPEMVDANVVFWAPDRPTSLATQAVGWSGPGCGERVLEMGNPDNALFYLIPPSASERPDLTIPIYQTTTAMGSTLTPHAGDKIVGYAWPNPTNISFPVTDHLGPLHAHAGPDQCLEESEKGASALVSLDGTQSTGDGALDYMWTWASGAAEGPNPHVSFPAGHHDITLTITDAQGQKQEDTVTIFVEEGPETDTPDTDQPDAGDPDTGDAVSGSMEGCTCNSGVTVIGPWTGSVLGLLTLIAVRRRRST